MTDQILTAWLWILFGLIGLSYLCYAIYIRRRRNKTTRFGRLFRQNRESITFAKKMFGDNERKVKP